MMIRRSFGWWACAMAVLLVAACGDSNGGTDGGGMDAGGDSGPDDAGQDAPGDAGGSDAGDAGDAGTSEVERGEYLAWHVSSCMDCHTPRDAEGALDTSMPFAGNPAFLDVAPEDDTMGLATTPNLTPSGPLGDIDDAELERRITEGTRTDGDPLHPLMPYWVFANMTDADIAAIIAYLRTLDPIESTIPDPQVPFTPPPGPADPIPEGMIPDTTLPESDPDYETARRGRYLAGMASGCIECHTQPVDPPEPGVPIELDQLFIGGREFPAAQLMLPSPPFPENIYTSNITPHADGIEGWTPAQMVTALKEGTDIDGEGLCPPMPFGMPVYGGMTDADAEAIGVYLTTIAPMAGTIPNDCMAP